MLGKTHYKLGIGYYLIFLPIIITVFTVNKADQVILGIICAAVAALLPDIDSSTSKINIKNPITCIPVKFIDITTKIFLYIIRCGILMGVSYLLWRHAINAEKHKQLLQSISICLLVLGLIGNKIIRFIPFYSHFETIAIMLCEKIKKTVIIILITAIVIAGFIYNFNTYNDWVIYLFGVVLIFSTVFPHRTFTHSIEGFLSYSFYAYYLSTLFRYQHLGAAFIIGYFSHIYLADIFTDSGIPLSFIPYLLRRIGVHGKMKEKESKIYNAIYKILSIRLRINLMTTGSGWEAFYYSVVLILAAYVFKQSFDSIRTLITF